MVGADQVVSFATGQQESDRISQGVDEGMDLGAQSAAGSPDCLVLAGFFCAGAALMGTRDGIVNRRVLVVGLAGEVFEYTPPNPGFGSPAMAPVGVLPVTEALRQIAPRDAGAIAVENGFDKQAVVVRRHANGTRPPGQQILDPVPLVIAKSVASHRPAPKVAPYESKNFARRNLEASVRSRTPNSVRSRYATSLKPE